MYVNDAKHVYKVLLIASFLFAIFAILTVTTDKNTINIPENVPVFSHCKYQVTNELYPKE